MTLEQYILNPLLKNNAILNSIAREGIKLKYKYKFDNMLLRYNGRIQYYLFHREKDNHYFAYIKLPSEVVKNFFYDVVFEFFTNEKTGSSNDLFKYDFKVYSNDPSFCYSFAYAFNKNGMFLDMLKSKMPSQFLTQEAKEKNPQSQISYVKSIYLSYLLLENRKLNKINKFKAESNPLNIPFLAQNIMNADEKIALRQDEGSKVSNKKPVVLDKGTAQKVKNIIGKENYSNSNIKVATTKRISAKKASSNLLKKESKYEIKQTKTTKKV